MCISNTAPGVAQGRTLRTTAREGPGRASHAEHPLLPAFVLSPSGLAQELLRVGLP